MGPSYDATGLNLCDRTNLGPLADLSLKVERANPAPPLSEGRPTCLFEMRTATGQMANLLVQVATPRSIEEAQGIYRAQGGSGNEPPDAQLSGIGDQAEGFRKESQPGFKYSEYTVHARNGNLVVKVWLAVGGNDFTPTQTLATKAETILKATMAQVPKA
jgi:hypothetical protein